MIKISIILPVNQADYLGNTIIDGLLSLNNEKIVEFKIGENKYPSPFDLTPHILGSEDFLNYSISADLIFLVWGKNATNFKLAEKIGRWEKTVFVDGSEFGKNNRYDFTIQKKVLDGKYDGIGKVDFEMLKKCSFYFRREKPYVNGVTPLPFGIESRYVSGYNQGIKKDIDFFCIFGQDEYPLMRRFAKEVLIDFCKKNNFTCVTERTKNFNFDDKTKVAGRDEYFNLLARSKVGISIGGGGFDTARFWEILGNNCILLTENIDIFKDKEQDLKFKRIFEFNNLFDFYGLLSHISDLIKSNYIDKDFQDEYNDIMLKHSSKARVLTIINEARRVGIIKVGEKD